MTQRVNLNRYRTIITTIAVLASFTLCVTFTAAGFVLFSDDLPQARWVGALASVVLGCWMFFEGIRLARKIPMRRASR